jgi:hypothetical protein
MSEDQKVMSPDGVESEGAPHERTEAEQAPLYDLEQRASSSHDSSVLEDASSTSTEIEARAPGSNEPAGTVIESFDREEPTAGGTGMLKKASKEFATYCESEIHQRRNSGDAFDEVLFEQAVEMTVRRLQTLESGGAA